ncbi:peptide ABC transporter, ATP-binding protein [Reinekea sp. MED297]|uniref:Peptide ABC transporter, ATP-binding protein n=1 Tax=Reinekea blandensis MED297 TaxID=314283 RepID=A4B9Z9_9GAMM|nr:ATP-binding cassette domain-containing protein [Reinekea blandensis]EAR11450.1 peptide ABC transporter, ATP-binding protein [Reinekea sp. MED297] [Reinekea blandensis MED297]
MATFLSATDLSFRLSNGDFLFNNISFTTRQSLTAIVGANGVGKSVLARCLAGDLTLDSGSLQSSGDIHYVAQNAPPDPSLSVIALFGLEPALNAAQRIEQGSTESQDFDQAAFWWEQAVEFMAACRTVGLPESLDVRRSVTSFSGGEQFRLMWAAALMARPDLFIFDEPSNHLDRDGREQFFNWLKNEKRPRIVISHDRELLDQVDAILELTPNGMHAHPGTVQEYLKERDQRWQQQQDKLDTARKDKKRQARQLQEALEKQQQRSARGKANAEKTGLDKLLRDGMKEASENSQGQQKLLRQQRRTQADQTLELAEQEREWQEPLALDLPDSALHPQKTVLSLNGLVTGVNQPNHQAISFRLNGAFRLRIEGPNGVGKSVLIKTLLEQYPAIAGHYHRWVPTVYLDQHFHHFDPQKSAIENLLQRQPELTEQEGRERLARIRLRNKKAEVAFGQLSGGEQLKTVLATELLGPVTPQLLLLDEPTNHMDLDSVLALEQALSAYQGALVVISHDEPFVATLRLTHRLRLPEANLIELG